MRRQTSFVLLQSDRRTSGSTVFCSWARAGTAKPIANPASVSSKRTFIVCSRCFRMVVAFFSLGRNTAVHRQYCTCDPLRFRRGEKQHALSHVFGGAEAQPGCCLQSACMPFFGFCVCRSSHRCWDESRTKGVHIDSPGTKRDR